MIRLIGFDADDTLWDNESIYLQAKRQFVELFANHVDPRVGEEHLSRVETSNVSRFGYGIRSFTLSMAQAAADLMGSHLTSQHVKDILEIGVDMLSTPVRVVAGARTVLEALASDYPLILITKGDTFEQERKIRQSGVQGYFKHIDVVSDKSCEMYRGVLEREAVAPDAFLMVGNSLRSDIVPVIELGAHAVYVPYEGTWEHEQAAPEPVEARGYHRISNLHDLPELVSGLYAHG